MKLAAREEKGASKKLPAEEIDRVDHLLIDRHHRGRETLRIALLPRVRVEADHHRTQNKPQHQVKRVQRSYHPQHEVKQLSRS